MGQSTSVCCGLSLVSATCDAAMFLLGDQPLISSSVIDSLIDAYEREKAPITVPVYRGKRGNPVIIDRSLFPALETLAGDTGAKQLFGAYEGRIHYVEVTIAGNPIGHRYPGRLSAAEATGGKCR